jgi:hypothetical protein
VGWKGTTDQILTTVLYPTRDQGTPVASMTNLSPQNDSSTSGFSMKLKDGSQVSYQTSIAPRQLSAGSLNATATALLLITDPQGKQRGVALGCKQMAADGQPQFTAQADFEFELEGNRIKPVAAIQVPEDFNWQQATGGIRPRYY